MPFSCEIGCACLFDGLDRGDIAQVEPFRIDALREEKFRPGGQGNVPLLVGVERIAGDSLGGHVFVDDLVHEGGVGTVFKQAAHEIGEQVTMRANRGIDAAPGLVRGEHDVMQRLSHAVQSLKFKAGHVLGHFKDGGDRVGVMCRKLRIDAVGHREQFAGIGDIGNVGGGLGGEDRETINAEHLCGLDLGVPVGAFHEADHDLAVEAVCEFVQVIERCTRAFAIGLYNNTKALPSGEGGFGQDHFDHVDGER